MMMMMLMDGMMSLGSTRLGPAMAFARAGDTTSRDPAYEFLHQYASG